MAINNNVEVIVFSNQSPDYRTEKDLLKWFTTFIQPAIDRQQAKTKKKYLTNWKHTPAIYLS